MELSEWGEMALRHVGHVHDNLLMVLQMMNIVLILT